MASSSSNPQAVGTAVARTPWRSGFADPGLASANVRWKNKKHYNVQKIGVDFSITPKLGWQLWSARLNRALQGEPVHPNNLLNSTWDQDGKDGRPSGLLTQISKLLSFELRHNLPSYDSYNKRTGTIEVRELFYNRQFTFVRALPELFFLACTNNPKGRYNLQSVMQADGTAHILISAAQGHSKDSAPDKEATCTRITLESLKPETKWVVHGTT